MLIYSVAAQSVILTTTHEGIPNSREGSNKDDVGLDVRTGSKRKDWKKWPCLGWKEKNEAGIS